MSFDSISNFLTDNKTNFSAEEMLINKNEIKSILYLSINSCILTNDIKEKISIKENHTIETFA